MYPATSITATRRTLLGRRDTGFGYRRFVPNTTSASAVLEVLHEIATAVATSLDGLDDWGLAGTRDGQYRSDLVADLWDHQPPMRSPQRTVEAPV